MYEVVYCMSVKAIADTPMWRITQVANAIRDYFHFCGDVVVTRLSAFDKYAFAFKLSGVEKSVLVLISLLNEIREEVIT